MIEIDQQGNITLVPKYTCEGRNIYMISHGVWKENGNLDMRLLLEFDLVRVRSKKIKDALYEQSGQHPIWFCKWFALSEDAEFLGA